MKRYIVFSIIFLMSFIGIIQAETYKPGDVITYKDIKFYVMEDKGDYLTLLKATPLTVDEVNKYGTVDGINYVNRYTEKSQGEAYDIDGQGYGGVAFYSSESCNEHNYNSCKYGYNESDIKHIVDSWSNSVLNQGDLKVVNIKGQNYKTRLINKDEEKYVKNYGWALRYGYWAMEPRSAWVPWDFNILGQLSVYQNATLRPVIHLKKSDSITKIKNNLKDINDTEFKIGDVVEYKGKEFYVLKNSIKTDNKLTIISKLPLSKEEIENDLVNSGTIKMNNGNDYNYDSAFIKYYYSENCYDNDHNSDCKTDYDESLIKPIIEGWAEDFFEDKLTKDELGYKARILTLNDLKENLGYVGSMNQPLLDYHVYLTPSEETPFTLSECFTMSQELDSNSKLLYINLSGTVESTSVFSQHAICPVVTISKDVDSNNSQNTNENKINVPNTLLKNSVFIVVIGIILIVVSTIVISVILKKRHK